MSHDVKAMTLKQAEATLLTISVDFTHSGEQQQHSPRPRQCAPDLKELQMFWLRKTFLLTHTPEFLIKKSVAVSYL